jgi:hypothetical protein
MRRRNGNRGQAQDLKQGATEGFGASGQRYYRQYDPGRKGHLMTETRSSKRQARKRHVRLKHRRSLAAGQRIPPALAVGFTTGERAALHIIADECRAHGDCAMTSYGLAARAGIGQTTAKKVLRKAREDGLITLERRWRASIVRIISPAWLEWLERQ